MSNPPADHFAPLQDAQFIVLTTFRASGTGVPTTVWFAEADGKLYITTNSELHKVKRIRENPRVLVAPSDRVGNVQGPALDGRARLLEPAEFTTAAAALTQKYGEQYTSMTSRMDASPTHGNRMFIEVEAGSEEA